MTRLLPPLLPLAALLAGCQTMDERPSERLGQAVLHYSDGSPAGTARLIGTGDRVDISVTLAGAAPGEHGLHLHTTGDCWPPDFATAGGHLNPEGRQHGQENPDGAHLGDLPNAIVNHSGSATVSAALPGGRDAVLAHIFDADGTAIVLHDARDDYRTDPAGDSGRRIACGVFTPG